MRVQRAPTPSLPATTREVGRPLSPGSPPRADAFVGGARSASTPLSAIPQAAWNFVTVVAGDNSLAGSVDQDLDELQHGGGSIAGAVNAFAFVDRPGRPPQLLYFPEGGAPQHVSVPPGSALGARLASGSVNTGDPALLRDVVSFVQSGCPSDSLALNLWGHGGGWRGVLVDDGQDDLLTVGDGELGAALEGLGVDVLSMDACLMATEEVTDIAARLGVKRLVASQDPEDATGYHYATVLQTLRSRAASGKSVDADFFASAIAQSAARSQLTTISVARLEKLPALREALERFVAVANSVGGIRNNPALAAAWANEPREASTQSFDLAGFAMAVGKSVPQGPLFEAAHALYFASRAVTPEFINRNRPVLSGSGLSIAAPRRLDDASYLAAPEWKDSAWAALLRADAPAPQPLPSWAEYTPGGFAWGSPPPSMPLSLPPVSPPPAVGVGPAPAPPGPPPHGPIATTPVAPPPPRPPAAALTPFDAPDAAAAWHLNVSGPVSGVLEGDVLRLSALQPRAGYTPLVRVTADPVTRTATVVLDAYRPENDGPDGEERLAWNVSLASLPRGTWRVEVANTVGHKLAQEELTLR